MRSIMSRRVLVAVLALVVAGFAVTAGAIASGATDSRTAGDRASRPAGKNIVETATAAGDFGTLVSLIQQAGLAETLATGGPFTVFAPTDAAFAKVPKDTLSALAANPTQLRAVLLYHVAKGELRAKRVVKRSSLKTLNGSRLKVKVKRRNVKVNNAKVLKTNVDASNGVIHVINRVLLPPKR